MPNSKPSVVLLMQEYMSSGLWDRSPKTGGHETSGDELGISRDLAERIEAWSSRQVAPSDDRQDGINGDDQASEDDAQLRLEAVVEGFRLASELQHEVGLKTRVIYFGGSGSAPE
jgi:hypothetical protein